MNEADYIISLIASAVGIPFFLISIKGFFESVKNKEQIYCFIMSSVLACIFIHALIIIINHDLK